MLKTIGHALLGSVNLLLIGSSTLLLSVLIYLLALAKLLLPEGRWRQRVRAGITAVAESWISVNNTLLALNPGTHWDIRIPAELKHQGCYLVLANHQSWVDILVLQKCFNRKLPLLRFFLKKQLIWVPFLGIAWWALDFPFMHRASREAIKQRPELRGADLQAAREACEKFSTVPVAMMSFPEGTRFSIAKRDASGSPYQHLLKPKAGGAAQVLFALGERIDACVDVTIAYPGRSPGQGAPSFWELVSGQVPAIVVRAVSRPVAAGLYAGDAGENVAAKAATQGWISELWAEKDQQIAAILQKHDGQSASMS
jgi:1-acyl-sn-glycerol-3-phosphate acyltransferase